MEKIKAFLTRDTVTFALLLIFGGVISYIDNRLGFHTIMVEVVHALAVTAILIFCIYYQVKYPEIRQYGWNQVVLGIACLMVGSWVDILDDPPVIAALHETGIPFGRSWQQAFIKKILGYTLGIGLMAVGFFRWIPWMIETRNKVTRLNQRVTQTNREMQQLLVNLDERVEAERLNISRELHDEVAQQLTFLGIQLQICRKEIGDLGETATGWLSKLGNQVSDILKSVRQISRDLRPEPLFALGLVGAVEQFFEKLREQGISAELTLSCQLLEGEAAGGIEKYFSDRDLLHLFRVIQESIWNALKHGAPSAVHVQIQETSSALRISIEDDGKGLPWESMPPIENLVQEGHLGVAGLKERVEELHGELSLCNREAGGARLEVIITI